MSMRSSGLSAVGKKLTPTIGKSARLPMKLAVARLRIMMGRLSIVVSKGR